MSRHDSTTSPLIGWLETCVITLAGPAAGFAFHKADPFFLHSSMPWLVLVPLLVGAQHGLLHGLVSSVLLALFAFGHGVGTSHFASIAFSHWCLGGLLTGAIAGQFRDMHARRQRTAVTETVRLSERLERSERTGQILTLSHSRLEERLAAMRWSLSGSLAEAQRRMQERRSRRELGEIMLEVLASQAMVNAASLYWVSADRLLPQAVAVLGASFGSSQLHPLVVRAFRSQRLTTLTDAASGEREGAVLAAVPVLTSAGQVVGVVAIHQMSFMAFQAEQLSSLMLTVGQLGDMMNDRLLALPLGVAAEATAQATVDLVAPEPLGHNAARRWSRPPAAPEAAVPARKLVAARV
ncbi:MAG: hypothetical protein ABW321_34065, partial [Polyangiales bacterium]